MRTKHSLHHCIEHIDKLALGGEHVKLWIELISNTCIVYCANRTREAPRNTVPQPLTDIKV